MSAGSCCCAASGTVLLGAALVLGLAVALPLKLKKAQYQKLFDQEVLKQAVTNTPNPMVLQALKHKVHVYQGLHITASIVTSIPMIGALCCCGSAKVMD